MIRAIIIKGLVLFFYGIGLGEEIEREQMRQNLSWDKYAVDNAGDSE